MKTFICKISSQLTILGICSAVALCSPWAAEGSNDPVMSTDHALVEAVTKRDQDAARRLLDDSFSYTNRSGETWNKAEALDKIGLISIGDPGKTHPYGKVVYLLGTSQNASDKIRFVRVWVKRESEWKVLLQQDTVVVGKTATKQATVPVGTACENPCKTIPYQAPSAEAQAVVASWEALEDSVNHRDADGWASHVADEFVFNVKEDGNPLTKADRVAIIRKQAQGKAVTDIGTVVPGTMNVWVFGDTAVMSDQQQPTTGGNPYQAMRVWVKREGRWQLVYSQQTVIDHAAIDHSSRASQ
jgi:ketosteroid isomerase-like protein